MDFRFVKQKTPDMITILDVIELYNCDDGYEPGEYTVADIEPEEGAITLVADGRICVIHMELGNDYQ